MFSDWLVKTKNFSTKASHDAASRLNRVQKLTGDMKIESDTLEKLNNNTEFKMLSMSVKSQLRRAIKLYLEFLEDK